MRFAKSSWLATIAVLWVSAVAFAQPAPPPEARPTIDVALNTTAIQPGQQTVIAVVIDVPADHYAQADTATNRDLGLIPLEVTVETGDTAIVYETIKPQPTAKDIPNVGTADIYDGRFILYVPVQVAEPVASPVEWSVGVRYQICNKAGLCYPPTLETFTLAPEVGASVAPANTELFANFDPTVWASLVPAPAKPDESKPNEASADRSTLVWFGLAFVAGIMFNVVPCVLPVLPLKIMGFFEAAKHDRAKCVTLSLFFAVGMIAVFAALGLLLLVFGAIGSWGEIFSKPWFVWPIVTLLVIAAVGTFGLFATSLPKSVYAFSPKHDTYGGNVAWGAFTAVLSTPCTFGLFAGALAWAITQPAWLGVLLLVMVGVGMSAPYVVLSCFPEIARKFPRTGGWPEAVKQAMAFLLLATAAFFARPLLPDPIGGDAWWYVIFGLLAAGLIFLVVRGGMLVGWRKPSLYAVAGVVAVLLVPTFVFARQFANPPVGWVEFSDEALGDALGTGDPVLVKYTADWCANCQVVERRVFGNQEQLDAWRDEFGLTLIKADLTTSGAAGWPSLVELNPSRSIPFTAVYVDGEVRELVGIYSSEDLRSALQ
ncbi:MAG: cytochrome c biogenesis protein CcdA [Planctomycetota bacterium]